VDYYLSSGSSIESKRVWRDDEVLSNSFPFKPISIQVFNRMQRVSDTLRSTEPIQVEMEYILEEPIAGLRVGLYVMTSRAEIIFTSFDTDDPQQYDRLATRLAGKYVSRCTIPADTFNEGRYMLGVNASSFKVKRYFHDEQALIFNVDAAGAPGMQWPEARQGSIRPRLEWKVEVHKV
jgi:lipopolysaccharide transport system ATP-binding protein